MARDDSVEQLVDKLELPFNEYGVDPYGISRKHLVLSGRLMVYLYRHYFRVKSYGVENVPKRGRAMLVGNHSGGIALDAFMVVASMLVEMDPPRLAQGMIEKFLTRFPFSATWMSRTGQFVGIPEHAERLLRDERLLMVFPEGARGTAKLFPERNSLVEFGTGFMRLALQTRSPIVPMAFVGGGEAIPTITNLYGLGKLVGLPYVPVTPWLLPLPLPVPLSIEYGEPMKFEGTGTEDDEVIHGYVNQVKARIAQLLEQGRERRRA